MIVSNATTHAAFATVTGGLFARYYGDLRHARAAIEYARTVRIAGGDGAHVARALRIANQSVRWVREDIAAIRDVSLCPCGSVYRCTCVAPF